MAVMICPSCAVANSDTASVCHCCGRKFSPAVAASEVGVVMDTLGYIAPEQRRQCRAARRALISAAIMCAIRAVIYPWLMTHSPAGTFGTMDPVTVEINSAGMTVFFFLCALWASSEPLVPSLLCLALYVGISIPDLIHPASLLGSGIISKTIMSGVILRAVIAGVLHRMLRRDVGVVPTC